MKGKRLRYTALLALLVAAVLLFGMLADGVQRSGGQVDVSFGTMETPLGDMNYKLYTPQSATEDSPAPGVLLLHGYQNDSETCSAYAIELARRGAVVLSLDEYGHGYSQPGLLNRGYVNHRVKVNFGEDSAKLAEKIAEAGLRGVSRVTVLLPGGEEIAGDWDPQPVKLGLSPMEMSPGLTLTVVLEQIYRAFKIIHGEAYHK